MFKDGVMFLLSNIDHAYVVYLLSLATHLLWFCFRYNLVLDGLQLVGTA
jgi:hypothetical protein